MLSSLLLWYQPFYLGGRFFAPVSLSNPLGSRQFRERLDRCGAPDGGDYEDTKGKKRDIKKFYRIYPHLQTDIKNTMKLMKKP